jgi:glutathione S-transferase
VTTVRFEPDSWARSAAAFDEVADGVAAALAAHGAIGGGGATRTDAAVAAATAALRTVVEPVFRGLAGGLRQDADTMRATAAHYARTEEQNVQAGGGIGGL